MDNYLYHHGIKGMHWGIRRFQNEDGTLSNEDKYAEYITNNSDLFRKANLQTGMTVSGNPMYSQERISKMFAKLIGNLIVITNQN